MIGRQAVREHVTTWVDRAIDVQDGVVRAHVAGVRDGALGGSTGEVTQALESQYLATVSGSGAVVGGAASVPGLGTGVAVGLSVAETVGFLDATALFTLAVAENVGCPVTDRQRRRALLLVALLGDEAVALVPGGVTADDARGWAVRLIDLPDDAVAAINRIAEKWLITRFGPRQSMFVLGRLAPFGIGAAVGAAGNAVTAKGVIARVRTAFAGHVPVAVPAEPEVTEPAPSQLTAAAAVSPDVPPQLTPDVPPQATPDVPPQATPDATPQVAAEVAPPAGKYAGLFTMLAARADDEFDLLVADADAVVTGGLPATARRNPAWWANEAGPRTVQASAWLAAGLHVNAVDLTGGTVRLRRGPAPAAPLPIAGA